MYGSQAEHYMQNQQETLFVFIDEKKIYRNTFITQDMIIMQLHFKNFNLIFTIIFKKLLLIDLENNCIHNGLSATCYGGELLCTKIALLSSYDASETIARIISLRPQSQKYFLFSEVASSWLSPGFTLPHNK